MIVLADGETMPTELGAGEIELKPTRSLRFAPWEADTGLGAASCVADADEVAGKVGRFRPIVGVLELLWVFGVADWKSSNSSSSAPPADSDPKPSSMGFADALFPFEAKSFGGVFGGKSSASKLRISISGSFFFGGAGF